MGTKGYVAEEEDKGTRRGSGSSSILGESELREKTAAWRCQNDFKLLSYGPRVLLSVRAKKASIRFGSARISRNKIKLYPSGSLKF